MGAGWFMSHALFGQVSGRGDLARDLDELDALVHGTLAQACIRGVFGHFLLIHQQTFGAVDQLAFGQFVFGLSEPFT